jgi:Uma2 family endonuclease
MTAAEETLPMATAPQPFITAEQFARRPDPGHPEELVKGRIVPMPPPGARAGFLCNRLGRLLGNIAEEHDLGYVLNNDSGVVTERGPDSVRGPDVSFYSHAKLPKGSLPLGYPDAPPDLIAEVLSPHDRWPVVLAKVAEYRNAGVDAVIVVDPERRIVHLYDGDEPVRVHGEADELALPGPLAGHRIPVARILA